jgi:glutaredoxin
MGILRFVIGKLLLLINYLTWPSAGLRDQKHQIEVEEVLKDYSLYQFNACPFCIKVRREMRRLNLPIELKDARNNEELKAELLAKGGSPKVPCLRIGDEWMYESGVIIEYLQRKFAL